MSFMYEPFVFDTYAIYPDYTEYRQTDSTLAGPYEPIYAANPRTAQIEAVAPRQLYAVIEPPPRMHQAATPEPLTCGVVLTSLFLMLIVRKLYIGL